jgi:hypothetical protein
MIRAVYVLLDGGVCIYSRIYDPALASPMLMSSFISAVSAFSREAMGDELRGIESDGRFVFVADHDRIITVVIAESPEEISPGLIDNIGINFLSRYSKHAELDLCETSTFREFDGVLDKIIPPELLESTRIDPVEPLDALSLIEVPQTSTELALLLIRKKSLSVKQAATELSIDVDNAHSLLEQLVEMGKVGRRTSRGSVMYFV